MAELTVFQPLAAPAETGLEADPAQWLPEGSRAAGPDRWRLSLRGAGITRFVRCSLGPPVQRRRGVWRTISWEPLSEDGDPLPFERMLPTFAGDLAMLRDDDGRTTLVLDGTYDVPLGAVGEAVDWLVLGRVARASATRLLAQIACRLDQITRPLSDAGRTTTQ